MANKISILGLDGKEKSTMDLPAVFTVKVRFDLIRRAVISAQAAAKQPQGRDHVAGKRNTAESQGTGLAQARIPRIKGTGFPSSHQAGFAPGTVKGRAAHPPKAEKILIKKINKKERKLALLSAISATGDKDIVAKRGHKVDGIENFPIVIDDKIQTIKKTAQVLDILSSLGMDGDLDRVKTGRSIRAGKGKRRGRKYKRKKGLLIVVKEDFGLYKGARNIPGVDIINIRNLACENLAPGTHCGRLTVWTQSAVKQLEEMKN